MTEFIIKKTFTVDVGEDAAGIYYAVVKSIPEQKDNTFRAHTIRVLMNEVSRVVRKRCAHLHRFPLPEKSPIITLEQDRYSHRIITPPNGAH